MKNKDWLKEQMIKNILPYLHSTAKRKEAMNYIDRLRVPKQDISVAHDLLQETTTLPQEDFDLYWNCINNGVSVNELKQKEKVAIPQFVADYIRDGKADNDSLNQAFAFIDDKENKELWEWMFPTIVEGKRENQETFARAWLDGYGVEKEKLYRVVLIKGKYLIYNRKNKQFHNQELDAYVGDYEQREFTEQEIKAIDERFWIFAEEVTE